jgi:hypothetical protein
MVMNVLGNYFLVKVKKEKIMPTITCEMIYRLDQERIERDCQNELNKKQWERYQQQREKRLERKKPLLINQTMLKLN